MLLYFQHAVTKLETRFIISKENWFVVTALEVVYWLFSDVIRCVVYSCRCGGYDSKQFAGSVVFCAALMAYWPASFMAFIMRTESL